uniref:Uncharacterized protein n=1 Tax=Rhizophora mucronata TaxID=61149 RepID=A0A2P2L7G4_RHIMU
MVAATKKTMEIATQKCCKVYTKNSTFKFYFIDHFLIKINRHDKWMNNNYINAQQHSSTMKTAHFDLSSLPF